MGKTRRPVDPKTEKLLRRVGYTRLIEKGLRAQRPDFPDLTVDNGPTVAPTSDRIAYAPTPVWPKAQVPAGFMIGHSHKQGLEVMPVRHAEWAGGKKS